MTIGKNHQNNNIFPSSSQPSKPRQAHIFEDKSFDTAYLNPRYRDLGKELLKQPIPPHIKLQLPSWHRNARTLGDLGLGLEFTAGMAMMMDKNLEDLIHDLTLMTLIGDLDGGQG